MPEPRTKIDYAALVATYYENLNENLRHFRGGEGFLETWVHDEDHNRSLLEILDLAASAGLAELEIALPPDLSLDWERLRGEASSLGRLERKGASLFFSRGREAADNDELLPPAYRGAVSAAAKELRYARKGDLPPVPGESWVTAELEGLALHLRVNEAQLVTDGRFDATGVNAVLLDLLIPCLLGRPLLEGIDHGVIRLENALRAAGPKPVKGVVTPENAAPVFRRLQELLRLFPRAAGRNEWRDPVPASWLALSEDEKKRAGHAAIQASLGELGIPDPGLEVVGVKTETRFVLSYPVSPEHKHWHYHLIRLEKELRRRLGFEAEVQLADLADRNRRVERTQRA